MMVPAGIEIIECRVGNPKGIVKSWILHEERATIIVDAGQDHEDAQRISNATIGEKSNPPTVGKLRRIGASSGSVIWIRNCIAGWYGLTLNQGSSTRATMANS